MAESKRIDELRESLNELEKRARWLESDIEDAKSTIRGNPVSYTHLDVYKRQVYGRGDFIYSEKCRPDQPGRRD